jgi:hypothetical protein
MHCLAAAIVLFAILVGASACTGSRGRHVSSVEGVKWAGFSATTGVALLGYDEQTGIDTSVEFALRGRPADVDKALIAAHFTTATSPGSEGFQSLPPLTGVDVSQLRGLRTARDRWTNSEGHRLDRLLLRGGTKEGQDVVYIQAFTTG